LFNLHSLFYNDTELRIKDNRLDSVIFCLFLKGNNYQARKTFMSIHKEQIKSALTHVLHPQYEKDLISLDLIQDLVIQDKYVAFTLELPAQDDSLANHLKKECAAAIQKFVDKEAVLDITVGINISKRRELEGRRCPVKTRHRLSTARACSTRG
jgi:metal-sulfur cluster biosynthetic enzyme